MRQRCSQLQALNCDVLWHAFALQALPTLCISRPPGGLELRADALTCCAVQARTTTTPQDFISSLAEARPHLKVRPNLFHALHHWWPGSTLQSLLRQLPAVDSVCGLGSIILGARSPLLGHPDMCNLRHRAQHYGHSGW